jgi:hypothetical protein
VNSLVQIVGPLLVDTVDGTWQLMKLKLQLIRSEPQSHDQGNMSKSDIQHRVREHSVNSKFLNFPGTDFHFPFEFQVTKHDIGAFILVTVTYCGKTRPIVKKHRWRAQVFKSSDNSCNVEHSQQQHTIPENFIQTVHFQKSYDSK